MTTLREAATQALEAMRCAVPTGKITLADWYKSIAALQGALAEQPASKPWVGLTEEERTDICDDYGANIHWRAFRAIEAKLQEKNA